MRSAVTTITYKQQTKQKMTQTKARCSAVMLPQVRNHRGEEWKLTGKGTEKPSFDIY